MDGAARSLPRLPGLTITCLGNVVLLVGLAWDAILHRLDPELAAPEGVFALGNPGHILFGLGLTAVTVGVGLMLLERRGGRTGRIRTAWPLLGLCALFVASVLLALTSDGGVGGEHVHVVDPVETTIDLADHGDHHHDHSTERGDETPAPR